MSVSSLGSHARGRASTAQRAFSLPLYGALLLMSGCSSCSYHVRPELFLETIHAAAADANKIVRLIDFKGAGHDHPHILGVDEGDYLKFAVLEVRSRQ